MIQSSCRVEPCNTRHEIDIPKKKAFYIKDPCLALFSPMSLIFRWSSSTSRYFKITSFILVWIEGMLICLSFNRLLTNAISIYYYLKLIKLLKIRQNKDLVIFSCIIKPTSYMNFQ